MSAPLRNGLAVAMLGGVAMLFFWPLPYATIAAYALVAGLVAALLTRPRRRRGRR